SRANQDNSPWIHRNAGYKGPRSGTVAGARDTVGERKPKKGQNRIKTGQNGKRGEAGKSQEQLQ
nr:hypothetical protein [Tanacetum cinerariifolium]